jgi:chromosome segregation ATPase
VSRREEVEADIERIRDAPDNDYYDMWHAAILMVRTLADEIDALRANLHEERAAYAVLLESHEIILDALTESDDTLDERFDCLAAENADLRRELDELSREIVAAHFANATLEKLREVVQSDEWCYAKHTDSGQMECIEDILYPKEGDNVLGE